MNYHSLLLSEVLSRQSSEQVAKTLPLIGIKNGQRMSLLVSGHIVAHDVSWAAQTGKHLLRTQNVSGQNQKHFLCPGHKICVRNKCCAYVQTGKHLCRQQCVRNNVSSFARALSFGRRKIKKSLYSRRISTLEILWFYWPLLLSSDETLFCKTGS